MLNSEILRDSLAGIQKKLAAIEFQLETTKQEIESSLKALDRLPEGESSPLKQGQIERITYTNEENRFTIRLAW